MTQKNQRGFELSGLLDLAGLPFNRETLLKVFTPSEVRKVIKDYAAPCGGRIIITFEGVALLMEHHATPEAKAVFKEAFGIPELEPVTAAKVEWGWFGFLDAKYGER